MRGSFVVIAGVVAVIVVNLVSQFFRILYRLVDPRQAKLQPQSATEGDFTDLEGFDLKTKLGLLRKNEGWKCQVKNEALEVTSKHIPPYLITQALPVSKHIAPDAPQAAQ